MPDPITAGQFGLGQVNLPSDPGGIEPGLLNGAGGGPAGLGGAYTPNWNFANITPLQVLQQLYGPTLYGNGAFVQGPGSQPASSPGPSDYWTRMDPNMGYIDPSLEIDPRTGGPATNYPAPGQGSQPQNQQSVISRIFGATPAGALVNLLRGKFMTNTPIGRMITALQPKPSWQKNAAGNQSQVPTAPAVSAPGGPVLFGFNPAQGGNTTRFDYGTGRTSRTPSLNPLFSQGGNPFTPVDNAPVDVRWAPNSGTGNFQADLTTKNFELSGGYPGVPNRPGTPDSGPSRFYNGPMQFADGVISPADVGPAAGNSAAKQAAYQQALRAVPMGRDGYSAGYVAKLNQWIAQNLGGGSGPQLPGITISGPPIG